MGRRVFLVLIVFLLVGFVFAGWDDFNNSNNSSNANNHANKSVNLNHQNDLSSKKNDVSGGEAYTINFYIAIIAIIFVIALLIFLFWALHKKPKNKWEKVERPLVSGRKIEGKNGRPILPGKFGQARFMRGFRR